MLEKTQYSNVKLLDLSKVARAFRDQKFLAVTVFFLAIQRSREASLLEVKKLRLRKISFPLCVLRKSAPRLGGSGNPGIDWAQGLVVTLATRKTQTVTVTFLSTLPRAL